MPAVLVGGMHDDAGRLVEREQVVVFVEDRSGTRFSPHDGAPRQDRQAHATTSPKAARVATRRTAVPLTVTRPLSIQVWMRVRVATPTSVRCRRSTRSRRGRHRRDRL